MIFKRRKDNFLCFLFLVFFFNLIFIFQAKAEEECHYYDVEGFEYIDGCEIVWKKGLHIIEKGLFLSNGATLKIEAGSQVSFRNPDNNQVAIFLWGGKILAFGTQTERITFSPENPQSFFGIEFEDYDESGQSFFRFVDFIDGSAVNSFENDYNSDSSSGLEHYLFHYKSGNLHIENSTFKKGGMLLEGKIWEASNQNGLVEIINSNFQPAENNIAINSKIVCLEIENSECQKRVRLKNNWYNSNSGPTQINNLSGGGAKILGNYFLENFRKSSLIVDPIIIIPGIMGSEFYLTEWELDPILHTYDDLLASLEFNGYENGLNLFEFPYEWRKSNEETKLFLEKAIKKTKEITGVSKVDLVAHSMGGLVARAYIESPEYKDDIDQLITLGTPNGGSVDAYFKWEAGEGFFTWKDKILKHHLTQEARHNSYNNLYEYIRAKIPSVRELLPTTNYLIEASNNKVKNYPDGYPENSFLEKLNEATNLEKMQKVAYINIFGESEEKTISEIRVIASSIANRWENGMPENFYKDCTEGLLYVNGDETVTLASAKSISAEKEIKLNSSHQNLPTKAQCEIFRELTNLETCEIVNKWKIPNLLMFNLFSPIDVQIVSPSGKRIGKDFETTQILNEIEGAFYSGYETENEFITIPNPEEGEYQILTQGTSSGSYEIQVINFKDDESQEKIVSLQGETFSGEKEEHKVIIKNEEIETKEATILATTDKENKGDNDSEENNKSIFKKQALFNKNTNSNFKEITNFLNNSGDDLHNRSILQKSNNSNEDETKKVEHDSKIADFLARTKKEELFLAGILFLLVFLIKKYIT